MKCKCGTTMTREIRPERYVCKICGRIEWMEFKLRKGAKRHGGI